MHEWALAEAIVEYVKEIAKGSNRIEKLTVSLGELQAIDRDVLEFSLREILKAEGLEVKSLNLITEDAILKCRRCGYEWSLKDLSLSDEVRELIHFVPEAAHSYIRCPRCGSRDFEIVKGRGVKVVEVIME